MKRLPSRKSHSWWWDSHVSPKNSRWLSENLEQMDRLVKEMLKLIEEEGDTFAKKAEMYYRRRPELLSRVEDFYRMYRALAERYDIVTGELRKNLPADLQSQGSGNSSDFGIEPASPSFSFSPDRTPEPKQKLPKPLRRAAGFDVFLGSTTSSDFSRKGSDDSSSSSSSESGSDSEDGKVVDAYENTSGLNARIVQLEDELREAREKLKEYEKGSNGQFVHLTSIDELHHDPKDEIAAEVVEVGAELHPESEDKMAVLETEISNHKGEIKSLKEAMEAAAKQFEAEISLKDHTIDEYRTQLDAAMNKFMQEKSTIEAELKSSIADLKLEAEQLSEKKSSLEIRILDQEQMIKELKVMLAESSERFFHEKSILESKVCSLIDSENILASKLQALEVVEVEDKLHSESENRRAILEAEISNHKDEIKCLKEAMEAAAKKFEAEISLKDHTIEEYKIQLEAAMSKFMQEKSTVEVELKSSIADLKLEVEQLSEKNSSLEIRILVQEQMIKELKVISAESFERLLHEKSILESKVSSLMESENILASKLQALEAELHPESKDRTVVLEAEISNHKSEIKCLQEAMEAAAKQFKAEISLKNNTIEERKMQHDEAMNKFMQENSSLEAELKSNISDLKLEADQLIERKSSLEIRILEQEQVIKELKVMLAESSERFSNEKSILESKVCRLMDSENIHASNLQALEDRLRELVVEKTEASNVSAKRIDELNQSLDGSKLKIDMLTSEKDELNARVSKLTDDAKCRDDNCRSMADHLHQLHIEHVNLIKEIEEARKNSAKLTNKVRELEEDVEKQRVLILDGAEEKREAIRQLCFSLEHYRDGYLKLRQMMQGHPKRLVVMAT